MSLRVSCVAAATDLKPGASDLILFPEYTDRAEVRQAAIQDPEAIIISATQVAQRCRGSILYKRQNLAGYLKAGTDGTGWTKGTGAPPRKIPVAEIEDTCVGLVICMDIQCANIINPVVDKLRLSASRYKVLCIPAYMGPQWLPASSSLLQNRGIIVLLCNHPRRGGGRKSFIMDSEGHMLATQQADEPLYWNFD